MPKILKEITNEVIYEKLLEHDKKFEKHNIQLQKINQKLNVHDKKLQKHAVQFEKMNQILKKHNKRFTHISKEQQRHTMLLNRLNNMFEGVFIALEKQDKKIDYLIADVVNKLEDRNVLA